MWKTKLRLDGRHTTSELTVGEAEQISLERIVYSSAFNFLQDMSGVRAILLMLKKRF